MRCGDPVGVYEPVVVVGPEEGDVRTSSRLNEPVPEPGGDIYHVGCWAEANGRPQ